MTHDWPDALNEHLPDHLTPNERAALVELVTRLRQRYGDDLLHIVLFGSKARGDFGKESDLDLFIVVDIPDKDYRRHWRQIVDMVWEVEFEYDIVTSLIIKDERSYETMRRHGLLLYSNIQQDGIALWTKRPGEFISASV